MRVRRVPVLRPKRAFRREKPVDVSALRHAPVLRWLGVLRLSTTKERGWRTAEVTLQPSES